MLSWVELNLIWFFVFPSSIGADVKYEILSNPEFLAEGTAIEDLLNADRILIGGECSESGLQAIEQLSWVYQHWIAKEKILTTNTWSSELSKLVSRLVIFACVLVNGCVTDNKNRFFVFSLTRFAGCKCIFSTTNIKYQFIVGRVWSDRRRYHRSCKSSRPRFAHRFEISTSIDRFWWQLLSEGYSQFSLHLRKSQFARSGCVLATGHRHEWISKNAIFTKGEQT